MIHPSRPVRCASTITRRVARLSARAVVYSSHSAALNANVHRPLRPLYRNFDYPRGDHQTLAPAYGTDIDLAGHRQTSIQTP